MIQNVIQNQILLQYLLTEQSICWYFKAINDLIYCLLLYIYGIMQTIAEYINWIWEFDNS